MNIVNRLTLRQLKLNIKRTVVTILGSIISVAMITAVCTLGFSFMDLMQRITISETGEWHVLYKDVTIEQLEVIKNDEASKTVILSRDTGYAYLEGSQNPNKPYIFIKEYNEYGFKKFPVRLIEGKIPERPDEIVISQAIITNGKVDYKIGDIITLDIGRRYSTRNEEQSPLSQDYSLLRDKDGVYEALSKDIENTYRIVGIIERPEWEPAWSPGYTALTYVDESIVSSKERINASVILKKVNRELFEHAINLASENGIDGVVFNNSLLRYYGVIANDTVRTMLFTLTAVIMAIIITGSVSLIYNAFAISVSDRSRYLGMLSSVGATKKQKRNSVFFEGAVIGVISIPLGIIAGLVGIGVTFSFINPMIKNVILIPESIRVVVLPITMVLAVFISVITIFISTWVPAKRASNISAIDAIRQTMDVKLTSKEVRTSKLTRAIFGIEGDLALKNLKRNKGRYKATLFSLVISIILFLVVSQFTLNLKKSALMTQMGISYDIAVALHQKNNTQDAIIGRIKSLDNIKSLTQIDTLSATSRVSIDRLADHLKANYADNPENEEIGYQIFINALDDESLVMYADEVGADLSRLKDVEKPCAIVIDTVNHKDTVENKYIEGKVVKLDIGNKIPVYAYDWELEEEVPVQTLEVLALTDKAPMGIIPDGWYANLQVIVSKEVLGKITESNENVIRNISTGLFIKSNNPLVLQEDIEDIQKNFPDGTFYFYNLYLQSKREEQMVILISVFTYGFISLITAICIANILNTISTSIALRKREFAMLKSVGMTSESFKKMINYESLMYGVKTIVFGIPISFVVMYIMHLVLGVKFSFTFTLPWTDIFIAIIAVFVIVSVAMLYSSSKIQKENIIDALKQEII